MDTDSRFGGQMTRWSYVIAWARRMLRLQAIVAVLVAAALWASGYGHWSGGWLLGSAFNLLYLAYLVLLIVARAGEEPTTLTRRLAVVASLRLWVAVVFLTVVLKTGAAHFGATVCGLLSFKLILFLEVGLQRR